jgi:hypothetical protein
VAQPTDLRASLALGTVKKRIRMCGRPAVPNISAMPTEIAEIGSLISAPGPMMASFLAVHFDGLAEHRLGAEAELEQHHQAMKVAPPSSITALMICTQVVAVMPPNST